LNRISLRPIRADDRAFLLRLYATTREAELAQVPWTEPQKAAFLQMQFEAQDRAYRASFPTARLDLIESGTESGREPIGRLYVDAGAAEIRLIDIALLPEEQRKGLGTALLQQLIEEARTASLPLTLHVEQSSPARRLYERLGFVAQSQDGLHISMRWVNSTEGPV
jgi:GNAT superfamily N-acetyltransferase